MQGKKTGIMVLGISSKRALGGLTRFLKGKTNLRKFGCEEERRMILSWISCLLSTVSAVSYVFPIAVKLNHFFLGVITKYQHQ
jgi:hypothetical protein